MAQDSCGAALGVVGHITGLSDIKINVRFPGRRTTTHGEDKNI